MSGNNDVVVVSNHLLRAGYQLTDWEHRIINVAAAQIERGQPIEPGRPVVIRASEMADLFDTPPANIYKSMATAAKRLMRRVITVQYTPEGKPEVVREKLFHWVTESDYARDLNAISLVFSERVIPYLTELSREFAQYRVEEIMQLSGKWAPRIFQLLMTYRQVGHFEVSPEDLAFQLELSPSYKKDVNRLKFNLLIPAIKQIQERLPQLGLTMSERRSGRRILAFQFAFTPSKVQKPELQLDWVDQAKTQQAEPVTPKQKTSRQPSSRQVEKDRKTRLRAKLRDIGDLDW